MVNGAGAFEPSPDPKGIKTSGATQGRSRTCSNQAPIQRGLRLDFTVPRLPVSSNQTPIQMGLRPLARLGFDAVARSNQAPIQRGLRPGLGRLLVRNPRSNQSPIQMGLRPLARLGFDAVMFEPSPDPKGIKTRLPQALRRRGGFEPSPDPKGIKTKTAAACSHRASFEPSPDPKGIKTSCGPRCRRCCSV